MADHPFKPGDVLRWDSASDLLTAIVGDHDHKLRDTKRVPLLAWKFDHSDNWVANSRGNTIGWRDARLVTGDEADRIHAEFAAAQLLGQVRFVNGG